TGPARYESFTFSDLKVKLYGKTAVLTGFVDVKMVGQDVFRVRTLQVYTENNGQWQMAAHQSTRLGRYTHAACCGRHSGLAHIFGVSQVPTLDTRFLQK